MWLTIVAVNGADRFRMSIVGTPQKIEHSEADIRAALKRAMGRDFDYEILSVMRWVRRELVADRYGTERVFIAGDAAHLMSPTGGFGMNTGIGDAVDLGWKLEAVHKGWGGRALLQSYDAERRPVGLAQRRGGEPQPEADAVDARAPARSGNLRARRSERRGPQGIRRLVRGCHAARNGSPTASCSATATTNRRSSCRTARRRRRTSRILTCRPRGRARARRMSGSTTAARRSISSAAASRCSASVRTRRPANPSKAAARQRGVPLQSVALAEPQVLDAYERRLVLVRPMAMSPGAPTASPTTPAR